MSNLTLILGETGSGKSHSIKNLDPSTTYIINVLNKPLPFAGSAKKYCRHNKNYIYSDEAYKIYNTIETINSLEECFHIKTIIIDDFQYILANEFMIRATEKGFNRFSEIAQHAHSVLKKCCSVRNDLDVFILSHSELGDNGKMKMKTIGKLLDEKITLEGMATVVIHCVLVDGKHKFLTQLDSNHIAKSPQGMFSERYIDNDLQFVKTSMAKYYTGDSTNEIHT